MLLMPLMQGLLLLHLDKNSKDRSHTPHNIANRSAGDLSGHIDHMCSHCRSYEPGTVDVDEHNTEREVLGASSLIAFVVEEQVERRLLIHPRGPCPYYPTKIDACVGNWL